jgi:hypothetical protein
MHSIDSEVLSRTPLAAATSQLFTHLPERERERELASSAGSFPETRARLFICMLNLYSEGQARKKDLVGATTLILLLLSVLYSRESTVLATMERVLVEVLLILVGERAAAQKLRTVSYFCW